jgi:hypothetical protein
MDEKIKSIVEKIVSLSGQTTTGEYSLAMEAAVLAEFASNSSAIGSRTWVRAQEVEPTTTQISVKQAKANFEAALADGLMPLLELRESIMRNADPGQWQLFVSLYYQEYCQNYEILQPGGMDDLNLAELRGE